MKTALIICPKYATDARSPYLTNELVTEFRRQGFEVDVVAFGEQSVQNARDGNHEFVIGVKSSLRFFKYFFLWPALFLLLIRMRLSRKHYDCLIHFAPLTVMLPAVLMEMLFIIPKRVCIVFDIYPLHQIKIGVIPPALHNVLHPIELLLMKSFNCITAMSPRNKLVIHKYYKISEEKQEVRVVHIWGAKGRYQKAKPSGSHIGDTIHAVFGGQVIPGRRLDKLIEFFKILRCYGLQLELSIFSRGPYYEYIKRDYHAESSWIHFCANLPRDEYLDRISSFDVGVIVTDEAVPLPTFPSKIIDYISAGLHCFCMVEEQSDLQEVIGDSAFVHINHFNTDERHIAQAVDFFSSIRSDGNTREIERLVNLFTVERAAMEILLP